MRFTVSLLQPTLRGYVDGFPTHTVLHEGLGSVGLWRGFPAALAQAEEDRPVELRVAADVVLGVWPEALTLLVDPLVRGDVALPAEDLLGVPVLRLAREVAAALEQQDPLARRRQPVRQRAAARAGADDDHVVVLHGSSAQTRAIGEVQAPVAPRSFG